MSSTSFLQEWLIGSNIEKDAGGIATIHSGLKTPPCTGWKYATDTEWLPDPQLTGEQITGNIISNNMNIFSATWGETD